MTTATAPSSVASSKIIEASAAMLTIESATRSLRAKLATFAGARSHAEREALAYEAARLADDIAKLATEAADAAEKAAEDCHIDVTIEAAAAAGEE